MNTISTPVNRQSSTLFGNMRSPRGFWGTILVLAMLPVTLLYQTIFEYGAGTVTHWMLAAGAGLIALAVFDFAKLPKWINWIGALSAGGLATIFFLQGLSDLITNDSLAYVAYQFLGFYAEGWLLAIFVVVWGGALLLLDSQGATKVFGFIALSLYLIEEIARLAIGYLSTAPTSGWKLLVLVPFVWLLFESMKVKAQGE